MQSSRKRKAKLTPPIIDDSIQEIRGRKGNTNKAAKQRAYKLKDMRHGAIRIKPDTEVLAKIRTRTRDKVKHDIDNNATEDTKDDQVLQVHKEVGCDEKGCAPETSVGGEKPGSKLEADRTPNMLGQDGRNASNIDFRNLTKTSSSSARKLFKESLQAQILQQACTRPKIRRTDMMPRPLNSGGDHRNEGQGGMTHLQSDKMHDLKSHRRDLHEHESISRLINTHPR